ncbi:MAG: MFS transporter [Opitutaceae bacterium]|nr:MFS transporter [Opitutaceae bacterium]
MTTPQSNPADIPPDKPKQLSLGVIFLTLYIDLIGFSIIFPLFPSILDYYLGKEGSSGLLGTILSFLDQISQWLGSGDNFTLVLFGGFLGSLYSLFQFIFAPIWGGLSDRLGRRGILLCTVFGTAISYLIWAVSGSFLLLILARLLGGMMSGNLSVATAAVADVTSKKNRAKGMGLIGAAFGLGFVTGPAIGGYFSGFNLLNAHPELARLGINPFSIPAFIAFGLSVLNLVWIYRRFTESLPPEKRAKPEPFASRSPLKRLGANHPLPVKTTNKVYFIFLLAFSGMEFTLSFLTVDRFSFGPREITWMFIFIGAVLIITQGGIVRRLVPAIGEKKTAFIGLCMTTFGFFILSYAPTIKFLYSGLAIMGMGSGLTTASLTALVSLYSSEETQGKSLGSFRSYGSLARVIGPIAASILFWWFGSHFSYALGALLMIIPATIALRLPSPDK